MSPTRTAASVATLPPEEKLLAAARRAGPKLPAGARAEFEALFRPENLAVTAAVLGIWATSHAFGVGFAVDLLILLGGMCALGLTAVQAAEKVRLYATLAAGAQSEADLERAATELAGAITLLGVTAFTSLVLKRVGRGAARSRSAAAARIARRQRIVQALGSKAHNPNVRGRLATALDYYERSFPAWSEELLAGHLKGIDYSAPVRIVPLKKGTKLVAFKEPHQESLSGNYFARPGASPRNLAVSEHGDTYAKQMRGGFERRSGRRHVRYEVLQDVDVLEAKTAGMRDTFTTQRSSSFPKTDALRPSGGTRPLERKAELVSGGEIQYVIPDLKVLRLLPSPGGAP